MGNKPENDSFVSEGLVVKSTGSWFSVLTDEGKTVDCKIKGKFRKQVVRSTNPVAVGDKVKIRADKNETPLIIKIYERENHIVRKASKLSKQSQVIAANIDQAILLLSLKAPKTYTEFIDRFLVSAEAYSIPAILIFNKLDSYDSVLLKEMNELISVYEKIGYKCISISAKEGIGLDQVKEFLKGKVSLISGNSGVGKTTLINKLDPSLNLSTSEISRFHQAGKHTTSFTQMYELKSGERIIDTPGIKGFGLVFFEKEELYHFFPEIFKMSKNCRFYNCKHIDEPGCRVIEAVKAGEISYFRYINYVNLFHDEENKYRK